MKYSALVIIAFVSLAIARSQQVVAIPLQCHPDYPMEVPPRIRKVCNALTTIIELGSSMENFINEKAPLLSDGLQRIPMRDSGVKRQDVDHVFLRFGRKRR